MVTALNTAQTLAVYQLYQYTVAAASSDIISEVWL